MVKVWTGRGAGCPGSRVGWAGRGEGRRAGREVWGTGRGEEGDRVVRVGGAGGWEEDREV